MRGAGLSKTRWDVETPARPFLGATPDDAKEMLQDLARQTIEKLKK
jgi:phage gpG-like protein